MQRRTKPPEVKPGRRPSEVAEYLVVDPEALAQLVGGTIEERFGGSLATAARALRIPKSKFVSLLSRIRSGKGPKALSRENVDRLRELVSPMGWRELDRALLEPAARELLQYYHGWLADRVRRLGAASEWLLEGDLLLYHGDPTFVPPVGVYRVDGRSRAGRRLLMEDFLDLSKRVKGLMGDTPLAGLTRTIADRPELTGSDSAVARLMLAWVRVLEPLIEHRSSGLVEPSWRDLSDEELVGFVEAGVYRENLLLARYRPITAAQEAVRNASIPFEQRYAVLGDLRGRAKSPRVPSPTIARDAYREEKRRRGARAGRTQPDQG